ncbi:MAG: hypothetical protein WBA63_04485 [Thermomicrobiales bacterium]
MNTAHGRSGDRVFAFVVMGVVLALVASMTFVGRTYAQDATPAASEAPVSIAPDLPTITVTATETVYRVSVPAGGVVEGDFVVELINETGNTIANANFVKLPEDVSVGDFSSVLSKSFKGQGGELPAWWAGANTEFVGGTFAAPGYTSQAIVTLSAGQWVIFSSNPAGVQPVQAISVAAPAAEEGAATPAAGATPVTEATPIGSGLPSDNQITITDSGFETATAPAAGSQVWQVTNSTDQVRDMVVVKVEGEIDEASATALAAALSSGDTVNGLVVGGSGALSPDRIAFAGLTLESGTYVIFISMPDANGGLQSANGAVTIVTVP